MGNVAEAEKLFRRALRGREKAYGADHPITMKTVGNLADLLRSVGKLMDAKPLYIRQAICSSTPLCV